MAAQFTPQPAALVALRGWKLFFYTPQYLKQFAQQLWGAQKYGRAVSSCVCWQFPNPCTLLRDSCIDADMLHNDMKYTWIPSFLHLWLPVFLAECPYTNTQGYCHHFCIRKSQTISLISWTNLCLSLSLFSPFPLISVFPKLSEKTQGDWAFTCVMAIFFNLLRERKTFLDYFTWIAQKFIVFQKTWSWFHVVYHAVSCDKIVFVHVVFQTNFPSKWGENLYWVKL